LKGEISFEDSCLGVTPRVLPSVLANPRTGFSSIPTLSLSEKLLLDATEFTNAVYEDLTQINDILTLKDPSLLIEGVALFYKGFLLVNSLEHCPHLSQLFRTANYHNLFEEEAFSQKSFLDSFYQKSLSHRGYH
jgi:hypothetical protein